MEEAGHKFYCRKGNLDSLSDAVVNGGSVSDQLEYPYFLYCMGGQLELQIKFPKQMRIADDQT